MTVERSRRRRTVALAAAILLLAGLGGGGYAFYRSQIRERSAGAELAVRGQRSSSNKRRSRGRPAEVDRCAGGGEAAGPLVGDLADAAARQRAGDLIKAVKDGVEAADGDRELAEKLVDIRSAEADDWDGSATEAAYGEAFRRGDRPRRSGAGGAGCEGGNQAGVGGFRGGLGARRLGKGAA